MFSVSEDSHVDIVTTINASKSDINPDFLYCASVGHHSNSIFWSCVPQEIQAATMDKRV